MIIELDINGAKLIVSGENLSISVTEDYVQRADGVSLLAAWRRTVGMTQGDLASALDLDQSFISRLERGLTSASLEDAIKIKNMSGGAVPIESFVRRAAQ